MKPTKLIPEQANSVLIRRGDQVVEVRNLRMRRSVLLLAELFKGDAPPAITHFALGSGIGTGTLTLPQDPEVSGEVLREEVHREAIDSVSFHDTANTEGDTVTDGTRTNKVLFSTTVAGADADALITEAALFGGTGASAEDGGDMVAWVTFPVIDNRTGGQNPDAPEDIKFDWILKFPLVQEG